jgi:hypothetical protein
MDSIYEIYIEESYARLASPPWAEARITGLKYGSLGLKFRSILIFLAVYVFVVHSTLASRCEHILPISTIDFPGEISGFCTGPKEECVRTLQSSKDAPEKQEE